MEDVVRKRSRRRSGALSDSTRVFVYGTLLAGEPNHRLLEGARGLGEARTAAGYQLYDLGPFPGMVIGGTGVVVGEVYEVDTPTLAALDRLEGVPNFYRCVQITLGDGRVSWGYVLEPEQVRGRPVIASGSWRLR